MAAVCSLATWLLLLVMDQGNVTSEAAIKAVSPHVTGTFTVPGIIFLQHASVYVFSDGHASVTGGDFTPLSYVLCVAIIILGGRLWRVRFRRQAAIRCTVH
jgi:hypothetical protein